VGPFKEVPDGDPSFVQSSGGTSNEEEIVELGAFSISLAVSEEPRSKLRVPNT
jgi:hypothetical protein